MAAQDNLLELMEERLAYHEAEIIKIKNAMAAYRGETGKISLTLSGKKRKVKWTQEILNIMKYNEELTYDEIKQRLIVKGINELNEARGRSSLSTTLSRISAPGGKLTKTDDGKFIKQLRRRKAVSLIPDNENSGEDK